MSAWLNGPVWHGILFVAAVALTGTGLIIGAFLRWGREPADLETDHETLAPLPPLPAPDLVGGDEDAGTGLAAGPPPVSAGGAVPDAGAALFYGRTADRLRGHDAIDPAPRDLLGVEPTHQGRDADLRYVQGVQEGVPAELPAAEGDEVRSGDGLAGEGRRLTPNQRRRAIKKGRLPRPIPGDVVALLADDAPGEITGPFSIADLGGGVAPAPAAAEHHLPGPGETVANARIRGIGQSDRAGRAEATQFWTQLAHDRDTAYQAWADGFGRLERTDWLGLAA